MCFYVFFVVKASLPETRASWPHDFGSRPMKNDLDET